MAEDNDVTAILGGDSGPLWTELGLLHAHD